MRFNETTTNDYDYKDIAKTLGVFQPELNSDDVIVLYDENEAPIGFGYLFRYNTKTIILKAIHLSDKVNNDEMYYEMYKALENHSFRKGYEILVNELDGNKRINLEKKYKTLLIDLDETIFDFKESEKKAVLQTLKKFKIKADSSVAQKFSEINEEQFQKFTSGKLTRLEFQENRFFELFDFLGVNADEKAANKYFIDDLATRSDVFKYSDKLLKELSKKYKLCAVTNGYEQVQMGRLHASKLDKYFRRVYVSSEVGVAKPGKEFFDFIFKDQRNDDPSTYLIIGDREDSDMKGGINAHIDTCYYNISGKLSSRIYTFEFKDLTDILRKL